MIVTQAVPPIAADIKSYDYCTPEDFNKPPPREHYTISVSDMIPHLKTTFELNIFTLSAEWVPQIDESKNPVLFKIIDPATRQTLPDSRVVDNIKVIDSNTGQIIKEVKPTASNIFSVLGEKPGIY
jgi:hypothetical protein